MEINIKDIICEELNFPEEVIAPIRESIKEQGLHHPLLVIACEAGAKIVAGKKRLAALKQLGKETVECKLLDPKTTDDQQQEIALHENLKRDHSTWYDLAELHLQLHKLNLKKVGKELPKQGGARVKGEKSWTIEDTAKELGISSGSLGEDIKLAQAVAFDPSLKKVKDKTTALKLIKNRVKRMEAEALALLPPDFEMNQVFLGDSETILKQIPDRTFDCCITDPPWSEYSRDESLRSDQNILLPIFKEIYRVLKNDSFLLVITSSTDQPHYIKELRLIGFQVQQYPLIWQKNRTITHGRRSWEFARDYEPIVVAVKGNPALNSSVEISSILNYPNLHYTQMMHPHEKPIELLKQLIKNCTYEGSSVLDAFSGSGVTLQAAKEMQRHFIGIEKDQKFYNQIVRRLA